MDQYIRAIESEFVKKDLPEIRPGDTIRVYVKVKEGNKERTQAFEGVVIKIRGGGVNRTFTVRRVGAAGVGVERIFPFASPAVEKITVLRKGKVRRAKLYYIRDIRGKIRIKQRRD
ncbi:50S ribosomal protein L19 [Kosmotoga arenicorallina S304]|uniref:Large ribosomal subunit protein bL19 n=1 Tax=Kosmotoga arenicorallina S304 TaxID=1453497 RepID=A0A176K2E7_9BACT|nr:50S ribosomal protein L19 [Kosmotoga arenicorallina]OAA31386.1 50S ribosomal protein L19 [Kosmotoga arenicorallina S304]